MVRSGIIDSNKHENKWCCASVTSSKVYRYKPRIKLYNNSHHFAWYVNKPIIHELRNFGCGIYTIESLPKNVYHSKQ